MKPEKTWNLLPGAGLALGIALIVIVFGWACSRNACKITTLNALLIGGGLLITGLAAGWLAANLWGLPTAPPKPEEVERLASQKFHELLKEMDEEIGKLHGDFDREMYLAQTQAQALSGEHSQTTRYTLRRIKSAEWNLMQIFRKWQQWAALDSLSLIFLELKAVSLEEIVSEVRENLEPLADKRGISLQWRLQLSGRQGFPNISGDATALRVLVYNLVHNALKFTPEHKNKSVWLNLEADLDEEVVRLQVVDEGIGIPERLWERIFEPGFTTGGQGIGLYVAKKIVDAHNGHIKVDKSEIGKGTTFTVILPMHRR
jgi:signal transduction histidine kinase